MVSQGVGLVFITRQSKRWSAEANVLVFLPFNRHEDSVRCLKSHFLQVLLFEETQGSRVNDGDRRVNTFCFLLLITATDSSSCNHVDNLRHH